MAWSELIKRYNPYNEQEKKDKEIMLYCIDRFDDILTRKNQLAHMTSSAFVINDTGDKVLMVYHNIYHAWSWPGGHADGEQDLLAVAVKELREETGVHNVRPVTPNLFSLDILPVSGHIKKGKYVSAHVHLSVAFLIKADENEELIVKEDENSGVKWLSVDKMNLYTNEAHMQKVYEKLISKMPQFLTNAG